MSVSAILVAVLILGGVGLTFGVLIAFANKKLKVWEDPRIDGVADLLPGTNCGACGYAGCRAFAEGLVGGQAAPAGCTNMGEEGIVDVASYLGVEAGEAQKRAARLLCAGGKGVAEQHGDYHGLSTCSAAAAVAGGGKGCPWGCLGLADCEVACDFDAIHMNDIGLPVVDPALCTSCGDCVEACPKDLFTIMPMEQKLIVQCKNLLEGDAAEDLCKAACTGCNRCADDAQPGVISIVESLAVVDYEKNDQAGQEAIGRCPTQAIVWIEYAQFAPERETAGSVSS